MNHCIEILSLIQKPGMREEFHRLYIEEALPPAQTLELRCGDTRSLAADEDSYFVISRFDSLAEREQGPRERILPLI